MLIYHFLRILVTIVLRIFFRRYQVDGAQKIRSLKPPLIVVGNHPNTFMDPMIVATLLPRQVGFIANGSIFNKYTRPIFRYFKVIPVYRKKDMPNADQPFSQAELNKSTFKRCYEFLAKNETVLLFPEGTSEIERRLREIKTGAARIALGAEYENGFNLGVKIIPVGINYSDPTSFRSEVFVNVGEPILVADFKDRYNPENFDTVEELTDRIEKQLRELTIVTEDEEEDNLVRNIEILYKNQLFEGLNVSPKQKKNEFILIRQIIEAVRYFEKNKPQLFTAIQDEMELYLSKLKKLGLTDEILGQSQNRNVLWPFLQCVLLLLCGLPLFLFGLFTNYIPYNLPLTIAKWITSDITYKGPILMTTGIFTFSFFYGIQIWAIQHFFQNIWLTILFIIALPVSGYFSLWYLYIARKAKNLWTINKLFQLHPSEIQALFSQRKNLFSLFETSKKEFIAAPQTIKKFVK